MNSFQRIVFLTCLLGFFLQSKAQSSFDASQNDITVLNYALTLENLEAAFYTQGLTNFSSLDFEMAGFGNGSVYLYFQMIMNHEIAHVNTIKAVITSLGGSPVPPCTYNFGITDVGTFVSLAQVLENVGVMAYDGAISSITSGPLQTAAATVATVEARHASYLNELTQRIPFPSAFDNATLPSVIAGIVSPYLQNCSYMVELPKVPPTANQTIITGDFNSTQNDIKALNYALTLEHLESAYYTIGMQAFSQSDFENAGYNATVYYYLMLIEQHEAAHVSTISGAVMALGGNPVVACEYNFTQVMQNVSTFVGGAQIFENVGVTAYNGAVNTISNGMIQTVAATIATVEARHAAYLNQLVGINPFPYEFDNATEPTVILNTIATYLINCPGPVLQLPVLPQFRQPPTTNPTNQMPTTTPASIPTKSPSRTPSVTSGGKQVYPLALFVLGVSVVSTLVGLW